MALRSVCLALSALVLATLGFGEPAAAADAPRAVAWDQLTDNDFGQVVTVCGPVTFAMAPSPTGLLPTLGSLILGGEPTSDMRVLMGDTKRFKVVIQDYNASFPADPATYYKGKDVCVIGRIVSALVGGYEIIPTHGSQIVIKGQGVVMLPRGAVGHLPAGAVSYEDAKAHIGQTATVCGVVVSGRAEMTPAGQFPPSYQIPANVRARLGPDFQLSTDTRKMHEIYLGDRTMVIVDILASSAAGLPQPAMDYYIGKDVCVKGLLRPSIMESVYMVVEDIGDVTRLN